MQELEKILEEIDRMVYPAEGIGCGLEDVSITDRYESAEYGWNEAIERVTEIIRNNMNDGWIPVEDRLPKGDGNDGELIVTDKDGRVWSGIYYGITEETDEEPCFHKWDEEMWYCYKPDVIAWRPIPEPYRPERSEV